jgi:insertion element IS1 protein InsB
MIKNETLCIKVSDTGICPKCKSKDIIKNGFTKNKKQQYICKSCDKRCIAYYSNLAYGQNINQNIIQYTKEGLGIRSTARLLKISTTTLLKRIVTIAKDIHQPIISRGKTYEVDEMCTYIRHKRNFSWIVLAFEKETKRVVTQLRKEFIEKLRKCLLTLRNFLLNLNL